ncbi:MAG: hypothetical protein JWN28_613 [Candidatus Saccharibacteria bacterium]|nr:hypothetical protein [Candidatus Saccharibacteria bacterium]
MSTIYEQLNNTEHNSVPTDVLLHSSISPDDLEPQDQSISIGEIVEEPEEANEPKSESTLEANADRIHKRYNDANEKLQTMEVFAQATFEKITKAADQITQYTDDTYERKIALTDQAIQLQIDALTAYRDHLVNGLLNEKGSRTNEATASKSKADDLLKASSKAIEDITFYIKSGEKSQEEHEKRRDAAIDSINVHRAEYEEHEKILADAEEKIVVLDTRLETLEEDRTKLFKVRLLAVTDELNEREALAGPIIAAEEEKRIKLAEAELARKDDESGIFEPAEIIHDSETIDTIDFSEDDEDEIVDVSMDQIEEFIKKAKENATSKELIAILKNISLIDEALSDNEIEKNAVIDVIEEVELVIDRTRKKFDEILKTIDDQQKVLNFEFNEVAPTISVHSGITSDMMQQYDKIIQSPRLVKPADVFDILKPLYVATRAMQRELDQSYDANDDADDDYIKAFIDKPLPPLLQIPEVGILNVSDVVSIPKNTQKLDEVMREKIDTIWETLVGKLGKNILRKAQVVVYSDKKSETPKED